MTKANFVTAADAFDQWRDDLITGKAPTLWPVGSGNLSRIEVGPGRVLLIGGAPGAGKTAFTTQLVIDALRMTQTLRVLICSVEMPVGALLDRQLARLSGINCTTIQRRTFGGDHADRLDQGLHNVEAVADRLAICRPPFDLANVAASADASRADLILLDYIQRIPPPGRHNDYRGSVNASMNYLRQFADADRGLIVVAAVGRTRDSKGRSSYDGDSLNLASFRESSELEFGADDCYILAPDAETVQYDVGTVTLKHLKSRHGPTRDTTLMFDRSLQRFNSPATTSTAWTAKAPPATLASELAAAWATTAPAADPEGDDF